MPSLHSRTAYQNSVEEITAYRARLGLENPSAVLWAPFGDERIRAVLVLAPCGFPYTTEDMRCGDDPNDDHPWDAG